MSEPLTMSAERFAQIEELVTHSGERDGSDHWVLVNPAIELLDEVRSLRAKLAKAEVKDSWMWAALESTQVAVETMPTIKRAALDAAMAATSEVPNE